MNRSPTWKPRLAHHARLRLDPIEGQELLLFPEAALSLNATAAAIVRLCDGERTTAAIVAELSRQFSERRGPALSDEVYAFLDTLQQRGLLE